MRLSQVSEVTGLPRSSIYEKIKVGDFPAPVKLGNRSVAWRSDFIEKWIDGLVSGQRDYKVDMPKKESTVCSNFASLIRDKRESMTLTQADVSEHIGVSVSIVQAWESDRIKPPMNRIKDLCLILNIDKKDMKDCITEDVLNKTEKKLNIYLREF